MKNKIIVKHCHIEINDYDLGDCPKLENTFSTWNKVSYSVVMQILEYVPEKRMLIVPRGVDVYWLERLFDTDAYIEYNCDSYDMIDQVMIKNNYLPRDNIQKEAIAFLLGEGGYRANKRKSQLGLYLNTGKGKSYCSIVATTFFKMRSIFITSSIEWLEQWKNYIIEYTDTKASEIFFIVGSPSIARLLKQDMSKYKYILASHSTIKSYGDTHGWDKVTELFKYMKCGLKFYDEAHLHFNNMVKIDAYTNTYKTFYITATPMKSDTEENKLYQYTFKNVPNIELFDEEDDPHTNYIELRYNSRPSPMEIEKCRNRVGFDKNNYSMYVLNKPNFYKILRIMIDMAIKNKGKNIFYIAKISSITHIKEWIENNYPELKGYVGAYHSKNPNKSKEIDSRIILSTTKSLSTAKDIKGLKMVVVLAEPFNSEVTARQSLGRTRDSDTYYINIVDEGFTDIKRYAKNNRPVFERYACSATKHKFTDEELDNRVSIILEKRKFDYNKPIASPFVFVSHNISPFYINQNPIKPFRFI